MGTRHLCSSTEKKRISTKHMSTLCGKEETELWPRVPYNEPSRLCLALSTLSLALFFLSFFLSSSRTSCEKCISEKKRPSRRASQSSIPRNLIIIQKLKEEKFRGENFLASALVTSFSQPRRERRRQRRLVIPAVAPS